MQRFGTELPARIRNSALPLDYNIYRCAKTHFGENQLAPNSIGISPLTTIHPLIFQHQSVRSSTQYYLSFNLTMVRSSGFGSITSDKRPIQARFHYGFSIHYLNLPLTISRRLILQQARSQTFSRPPTACKFMVSCSFHSPPGVLFTFPSRYCFTIGHSGIFSLTRWSSQIHTEFHVLHATWDTIELVQFSSTRLSLSLVKYSKLIPLIVPLILLLLSHYP